MDTISPEDSKTDRLTLRCREWKLRSSDLVLRPYEYVSPREWCSEV
jgi:hypothetical protein